MKVVPKIPERMFDRMLMDWSREAASGKRRMIEMAAARQLWRSRRESDAIMPPPVF